MEEVKIKPSLKIGKATFYFKDEEQKSRFIRRYKFGDKYAIGIMVKQGHKNYINGIELK